MRFDWVARLVRRQAGGPGASTAGLTLVEVIVALAILSLAVLTSVSTVFIGHRVSVQQVDNADKMQQLRSAIKMMADDLVYAQWDTSCNQRPDGADLETIWVVTRVAGYVVPEHDDPDTWPDAWPQKPINWNRVCVYYAIEGDTLIRQTFRYGQQFSRQTVLTGLAVSALDAPSEEWLSKIEVNTGTHLVRVKLMMEETKGEGTPVEYIEVSTQFFVP